MEQGHCQDAEGICFSDVQPLIMGCVWTMQPPDAILPHPLQQHEPYEVVHSHCLSFRSYIIHSFALHFRIQVIDYI